jgi:NAD(P)-dependent dehydrogenase (short-subunit alcohol dehydrogenase family)
MSDSSFPPHPSSTSATPPASVASAADSTLSDAPRQEMDLTGRKILITGGARGLGESFAKALIASGARVVITDILLQEGEALAAALGPRAHFVEMNNADPQSIKEGVSAAASWLGGIDGLVNNAAITNSGGVAHQDLTLETWDRVMQVNVRGTWLSTAAARPFLIQSQTGRVVNIASDTALWGAPMLLAYVASKGAVISMTKSLARELGEHGVTVNAIAPGLTLVKATEYVPQHRHDYYEQGRAIKAPQMPSDINAAVMFLLSRSSAYITGQVLAVNGGFVMH